MDLNRNDTIDQDGYEEDDDFVTIRVISHAKIIDNGNGLPSVGDHVSDGRSSAVWCVIGGMVTIGTGAKFANLVNAAEWPSSGMPEHFICEVDLRASRGTL